MLRPKVMSDREYLNFVNSLTDGSEVYIQTFMKQYGYNRPEWWMIQKGRIKEQSGRMCLMEDNRPNAFGSLINVDGPGSVGYTDEDDVFQKRVVPHEFCGGEEVFMGHSTTNRWDDPIEPYSKFTGSERYAVACRPVYEPKWEGRKVFLLSNEVNQRDYESIIQICKDYKFAYYRTPVDQGSLVHIFIRDELPRLFTEFKGYRYSVKCEPRS